MFHIFHKPLLKLAYEVEGFLEKRDHANAFIVSEILLNKLIGITSIVEHDTFKGVMKGYGGIWDELTEAESKFEELGEQVRSFSNVVGEVDRSKDYGKLLSALKEVIKALEWFRDHEDALHAACGEALKDMLDEMKEIKEVKDLVESAE